MNSSIFSNRSCPVEQALNASETGLQSFFVAFSQLHGYLSVSVCLFGVLFNALNIIVLTRPNLRSSTNWILLWIAVADLVTVCLYLPHLLHFFIFHDPEHSYLHTDSYFWIRYLQFVASFLIITHSAAIWLTVILALFRYIFVSQLNRGRNIATQGNANKCILLICIFSVLFTLPNIYINSVTTCLINPSSFNVTSSHHSSQRLYEMTIQGPIALQAANMLIQACCFKIIPCLLLAFITFCLLCQLQSAKMRRKSLTNVRTKRDSKDNRITVMLISLVLLFILTELPQGIMMVWMHFDSTFYERIYHKLGDLIDFVTLCNESINFVIYTTMSKDFRDCFVSLFLNRKNNIENNYSAPEKTRGDRKSVCDDQENNKNIHNQIETLPLCTQDNTVCEL